MWVVRLDPSLLENILGTRRNLLAPVVAEVCVLSLNFRIGALPTLPSHTRYVDLEHVHFLSDELRQNLHLVEFLWVPILDRPMTSCKRQSRLRIFPVFGSSRIEQRIAQGGNVGSCGMTVAPRKQNSNGDSTRVDGKC